MSENPDEREQVENEVRPGGAEGDQGRRSRLEERRAERHARGGAPWIGGAILIVVGIVLILQNTGNLNLTNWWALFIFIPAIGALASAWRTYQGAGGRLTAAARGSLIGGLVLTLVALIFLFNLAWGALGPILLILAGIGILLNAVLPG
jgi:hypothetical protein